MDDCAVEEKELYSKLILSVRNANHVLFNAAILLGVSLNTNRATHPFKYHPNAVIQGIIPTMPQPFDLPYEAPPNNAV